VLPQLMPDGLEVTVPLPAVATLRVKVELEHWPLASQVWLEEQLPQLPLQPSLPQTLPLQAGVQVPLE
jgi:hypothetical protein